MNIIVTYDASVASAPAAFKTVVNDVIKYFDAQFASPVTIRISVGWGEVGGQSISPGALAESISNLTGQFTYAEMKAALVAAATTTADKSAVGSLPATDPTNGGNFWLTTAQAQTLGFISASSQSDGSIGVDKTANWEYDTANTGGKTASGKYDLFAALAHEISEVLGRQMNFGVTFGAGTGHVYEPLDLFDFTGSGVRSFTPATAGRYFSVDNGATNLDVYSNDPGGDRFDWAASAGDDSFDAFGDPGVINSVTATDLLLLNLMGYAPTPDFTASTLALKGATLTFRINDISQGDGAASTAGVYLSTDSKITTADTKLTTVATGAVTAGAFVTGAASIVLPGTLTAGTYYLGVIADFSGSVAESDTTNDASAGLSITVVDSSNIASISGAAGARAFDVAGATLSAPLTVSGSLITSAALGGAETVTVRGKLTLQSGTALTVSEIDMNAAAATVTATASLTYGGVLNEAAGTISAGTGDTLSLTGAGDTFSGVLGGTGTIAFSGGTDTLASATLSATTVSINGATVTLSGALNLGKTLNVTSTDLEIAGTGATLTGGGSLVLSNAATNVIKGVVSTATLTNAADKIMGAGQLGGGVMKLVNAAGGTIDGDDSAALTIYTGGNTITNAGLIENTGAGGTTIKSAIANTGTLEVTAGTLTVSGAVSGTGGVTIAGGTADFTGAFTQNVTFSKTTGILELAKSIKYTGTVTGFSKTGTTSLDLTDITFSGATKATYSGTTTAGVLTVTDGTHTAKIHLAGDFTASTFTVSSDGHGGASVVDPSSTPAGALAGAMAGFAPRPWLGSGANLGGPARLEPLLAAQA